MEWNQERIDLVKRTVCPQGIPDDDFLLFIEQCRRTELDPLIAEAHCVKRNLNIGTKEVPKWVSKYQFQPSEAGMLSRAEKFPDYRGTQAAAVYSEDHCVIDAPTGLVEHKFKPNAKRGLLMGAWARVEREGRTPTIVWLDLGGYVQGTSTWGKIPATMVEKCARVAGLRKAYPASFGNCYIAEEMRDESEGASEEPKALPEEREVTPTDLKAKLAAQPRSLPQPQTKPSLIIDVKPGETEEAALVRARRDAGAITSGEMARVEEPEPPDDVSLPTLPPSDDPMAGKVRFGPKNKGKPIAELDDKALGWYANRIAGSSKPDDVAMMRDIEAEWSRRRKAS